MVKIGDKLPNAQFGLMTDDGPVSVPFADKLAGRKVVVFGFPGAFTPTCSSLHMPSITKNKAQYDAKGVDEVICIAVTTPMLCEFGARFRAQLPWVSLCWLTWMGLIRKPLAWTLLFQALVFLAARNVTQCILVMVLCFNLTLRKAAQTVSSQEATRFYAKSKSFGTVAGLTAQQSRHGLG